MSETMQLSAGAQPSVTAVRRYAALAVVTSIAIFGQAVTAGQFVNKDGADNWIDVHGAIADVSWVLALITAIVAVWTLRGACPRLVTCSVILFVITLAQTGIGHLITDDSHDGLVAVHIPLAFVIFGLTTWIAAKAVALARE